MNNKNPANTGCVDDQQELEVVTKSSWWVPGDWEIVNGRIRLPDGRFMNFWPELELEDDMRTGADEFKRLEWKDGSDLGLHFNTSHSALSVRPIQGRK